MAKSQKQVKQSTKPVISKADRIKLMGMGAKIVEVELHARDTVRAALMMHLGRTPEQLACIIEGYKAEWAEKAKPQAGLGITKRTVWNRSSDGVAVLNAFAKYHGMTAAGKATFNAKIKEAGKRDALVEYCRKVNKAGRSDVTPKTAEQKARDAWKNKPTEQVKALESTLKHATYAGLVLLRDWIDGKIAKLRAQGKASVTNMADHRKVKAKAKLVKAARKAA